MIEGMVSVIIPIYNGESFIDSCLKSVLHQTYKNVEIILINDGSKDQSLNKLKEYAKTYKNIILISQKNGGASSARNAGIKKASGEFLLFIDVDDTVSLEYIETLVKHIKDNDVLVTGYRRGRDIKNFYRAPKNNSEWAIYKFSGSCSKLYRSSVIKENGLRFPLQYQIGEDMYFNISVIASTTKIKSINYIGYNVFINEQSVTHTINANKQNRNTKMLSLLKDIERTFSNSPNINWIYLNFFLIKGAVLHILNQRKILTSKELQKEYLIFFNWLASINKKHYSKLKIYFQRDESGIVNIVCNIFIIAYKLHLTKILCIFLTKTSLGSLT